MGLKLCWIHPLKSALNFSRSLICSRVLYFEIFALFMIHMKLTCEPLQQQKKVLRRYLHWWKHFWKWICSWCYKQCCIPRPKQKRCHLWMVNQSHAGNSWFLFSNNFRPWLSLKLCLHSPPLRSVIFISESMENWICLVAISNLEHIKGIQYQPLLCHLDSTHLLLDQTIIQYILIHLCFSKVDNSLHL